MDSNLTIQYISDFVTIDNIKSWENGEIISIEAPTGSGKSHFIKTMLYGYASAQFFGKKKILYLVNRSRLKQQFEAEIEQAKKGDCIEIKTYQWLEELALYDPISKSLTSSSFLSIYDYIVCDEWHYFMSDASYNHKTDISLNTILKSKHHIKIFMSATTDTVMKFMNTKNIAVKTYSLENVQDNINKLYFCYKDSVIDKYLSLVPENEKVIYFSRSAKRAYELSLQFPDSLFVCSTTNKSQYKQYVDEEKVNGMLIDEHFNEKYLFCTSTLDNGVNIKDESIKHIIVDIEDFDIMMQCIGRKRIKNSRDKFTLIVRAMNNNQIGGRITQLNKKIEMAAFLEWNNSSEFVQQYPRKNYGNLIYDHPTTDDSGTVVKLINDVMLFKYRYDIELLQSLLEYENEGQSDKKTGYIAHVLKLLKRGDFTLLEDDFDYSAIVDYFDRLIGVKMFKKQQSKFKEWLTTNLINSPKGNHGSIGLKTINGYLQDNGYDYIVESKRETRGENRSETYWRVRKIIG